MLFRSGIRFESVWSNGFSLARTNFFLMEGLALLREVTGKFGLIVYC